MKRVINEKGNIFFSYTALPSVTILLIKDDAARIWESIDREGNGFLHYPQVAAFFRQVIRLLLQRGYQRGI